MTKLCSWVFFKLLFFFIRLIHFIVMHFKNFTCSNTNPHLLEMKQSTLPLITYNEDLLWKAFPLQEIFNTALHNSPVQDLLHYILFLIWGSSLIIFTVLVLLSHGLFLMSFLWASVTCVAPWSGEESVPTGGGRERELLKLETGQSFTIQKYKKNTVQMHIHFKYILNINKHQTSK